MSNLCFGQFLELGDKPVALVRHRNVPLNVAVICMVLYLLCSASERWAISAPRVLWLAGLMSGAGLIRTILSVRHGHIGQICPTVKLQTVIHIVYSADMRCSGFRTTRQFIAQRASGPPVQSLDSAR